jgi:hypothetical protein
MKVQRLAPLMSKNPPRSRGGVCQRNAEKQVVTFDTWHALEIVIKNESCTLQEYLDEIEFADCTINGELDAEILGSAWLRYSRLESTIAMKIVD